MKNNKKLVVLAGAAALGLVAATGVTSGFAWFAVNASVSATSLNVTAKTNASYLLINTSASTEGGDTTKAAADPANTAVYPVAYTTQVINWNGQDGLEDTDDDVTIPANKWYTATVTTRDNATGTYSSLQQVDVGASNYFVHYDFYLYLATGSDATLTEDLTVTADFTGDHSSVKAAVTSGDKNYYILASGAASHTFSDMTFKIPSQTSDYVRIQVELFIDGTDTNVKSTTDIATLVGEINLTFSI